MLLWLILSQRKQITYYKVIKIGSFGTWIPRYIYYVFLKLKGTISENISPECRDFFFGLFFPFGTLSPRNAMTCVSQVA